MLNSNKFVGDSRFHTTTSLDCSRKVTNINARSPWPSARESRYRTLLKVVSLAIYLTLTSFGFATGGFLDSTSFTSLPMTDAQWFYLDAQGNPISGGGGKYPTPQIKRGSARNVTSITNLRKSTVTITWSFGSDSPNMQHAAVLFYGPIFHRTSGPAPDLALNASWTGITQIDLSPGGTGSISLTLSGMPDEVCAGDVLASYQVAETADVQGCGGNQSIRFSNSINSPSSLNFVIHAFEVDASPTGYQATPWAEVLTYSCGFANGKSGTLPTEKALTKGLSSSSVFKYDGSMGAQNINKYGVYNLSEFLLTAPLVPGDCQDISAFLLLLFSSQGEVASIAQICTTTWIPIPGTNLLTTSSFLTNPILPIGSSVWGSVTWQFHQIVFGQGSLVFDACARLSKDLSGNYYNDAPAGWVFDRWWQLAGANPLGLVLGPAGGSGFRVVGKTIAPGPYLNYPTLPSASRILIVQGIK